MKRLIDNSEHIELLPEIKNVILDFLDNLELKDIDVQRLKFEDVIFLLQTHRNKNLIRKLIYDNMKKIVLFRVLNVNTDKFNDLDYICDFNIEANFTIEIINYNKEKLLEKHDISMINDYISYIEKRNYVGPRYLEITEDFINDMVYFFRGLIKIKEVILAKELLNINRKNYLIKYDSRFFLYENYMGDGNQLCVNDDLDPICKMILQT